MKPNRPTPPCFIHVDLDGLWTLSAAYGFDEGESFARDPIFEHALHRMLDLFDRLGIKATFFIVGRDLELPHKRDAVKEIIQRGHDLANHSYRHLIGLEDLSEANIREEIESAQRAIEELWGQTPIGFRAPGYNAGGRVLTTCQKLGFKYDGSMLPTCWGPLLRFAAGRWKSSQVRTAASGQYGRISIAAMDLAPQWVRPDPALPPLVRLPLAVSPLLRLPLHASLGIMLGERRVLAGLRRLARRGWPITYLLHGFDCAAQEEYKDQLPPALRESRVFTRPLEEKMGFLEKVLGGLKTFTTQTDVMEYLREKAHTQTLKDS
ncbi:polysaccharide deacetylase family protein [Candidatus Sumerlaeota bacterium]|nr:polysaccharide deacetylase family protein [Candidatus Sumerlaeota bacterium]